MEQLNFGAEEKHLNLKTENFQKEECNADSGCENEKGISYTGPTGM